MVKIIQTMENRQWDEKRKRLDEIKIRKVWHWVSILTLLLAVGLASYLFLYRPFVSHPPIERLEAREEAADLKVEQLADTLRKAERLLKGPWGGISTISTIQGETELKAEIEQVETLLEEANEVHAAAKYRLRKAEDKERIEEALAQP